MNKSLLIALFILTKVVDLFTTYLVTNDLSGETSLLVVGFNLGWSGFIIANIIFVAIVIVLLQFVNLNYVDNLEQKNKNSIISLKDYICKIILSTNDNSDEIGLRQLLFKAKVNKLSCLFVFIKSLVVTMIFINIGVSLNNIFEYYGFSIWGNTSPFIISQILFLSIVILFGFITYMMIRNRFHRLTSNI
jgi:hypothetical protein